MIYPKSHMTTSDGSTALTDVSVTCDRGVPVNHRPLPVMWHDSNESYAADLGAAIRRDLKDPDFVGVQDRQCLADILKGR